MVLLFHWKWVRLPPKRKRKKIFLLQSASQMKRINVFKKKKNIKSKYKSRKLISIQLWILHTEGVDQEDSRLGGKKLLAVLRKQSTLTVNLLLMEVKGLGGESYSSSDCLIKVAWLWSQVRLLNEKLLSASLDGKNRRRKLFILYMKVNEPLSVTRDTLFWFCTKVNFTSRFN